MSEHYPQPEESSAPLETWTPDQRLAVEAFATDPRFVGLVKYMAAKTGAGEPEDILQETLMRVPRSSGPITPEGSRAWARTVVTNIAISRYRKKYREIPNEDLADCQPAASNFESSVDQKLYLDQVLDRLLPSHQEVLRLIFLEDLSYGAAAKILGLPESTIKSRVHKAIGAARRMIQLDNS